VTQVDWSITSDAALARAVADALKGWKHD